jgi:integrase
MLECGLRVGEVHNLSLDDLHFEKSPYARINGKGGRQRIVYLSPPAQDALQRWLTSRPVTKDRAVFISRHGKRITVSGIQYILRKYCSKANVQVTAHQLRHTFGRRMTEANLPITSLQSLLGHKHVRTTQIYVHLSNSHLQTEYEKAVSQLSPPNPSTKIPNNMRKYLPKPKQINWEGYLVGFPDWLADSLRTFCSRTTRKETDVQRTRNILSQLVPFFRWVISSKTTTECHCPQFSNITPKLWFTYTEIRLRSGIKPTTLNTTLRTLQSFLKFAHSSNHDICERTLEVRPLTTPEALPRDLTQAQLNRLLAQADPFDYVWILLMAHSGLRTCEVRNLRWHDIDLNYRTIRIEESKGLRSRIVFFDQATKDVLKKLPHNSEFVFTNNGHPLSNRYYQSRLITLGKDCSVQATPHQLRRTCATMLLNTGMSIFAVQTILGHQYVDTTLRYTRVYDSTVAKDYEQVIEKIQENSNSAEVSAKTQAE